MRVGLLNIELPVQSIDSAPQSIPGLRGIVGDDRSPPAPANLPSGPRGSCCYEVSTKPWSIQFRAPDTHLAEQFTLNVPPSDWQAADGGKYPVIQRDVLRQALKTERRSGQTDFAEVQRHL